MASLTQRLKERARDLGFDWVAVTPIGPAPHASALERWLAAGFHGEMAYMARSSVARSDPRRVEPSARSVIVLGMRYIAPRLPHGVLSDPSRGRIAVYAWRPDYHDVIRPRLHALDAWLRQETGREALARCYVDTGPVLERDWAMAAGLGFIGKNTCLIRPGSGSWLFLSVMLVPEALDPDPPPAMVPLTGDFPAWRLPDGRTGTCGSCHRCLVACPTQAFPEPYVLDARRCISYLTIEYRGFIPRELRPLMGNWIFGCDVCQDVCPWCRAGERPMASREEVERWAPRLLDLLALDDAGFRARFRRTPLTRAKRRGLLRNVCVAIGNWRDPAAVPALARALSDAEPLIRGHAAWALGRIGGREARDALRRALKREPEAPVVEEIRYALELCG